SPYEITIQGRKVIGLDQVRRRVGFLFQGGLLLRWDAERIASLLAALPEERPLLAEGLRARAVGIDELLGRSISPGEMISCFEALLQESYQAHLSDMTIGAEIERQARSYEQERYAPMAATPAGQHAASGEG
ncbi:MAG TPA: hypothetical protein VFU32_00190, partial [Ktedonobacterales bacterium]|nr:hypothetical protein [Ktedonobacterales bacterium]